MLFGSVNRIIMITSSLAAAWVGGSWPPPSSRIIHADADADASAMERGDTNTLANKDANAHVTPNADAIAYASHVDLDPA